MKTKIINTLALCLFLLAAVACDDNFERFETIGYTGTPAAIESISSEELPGQIKLKWEQPQGDYEYAKIRYYDFLQKKDVYKIVSKGTSELVIDGTRARFGEYDFSFQTFNANHEGGKVVSVKAKSGKAPSTTSIKETNKIAITGDMLSTNNQEPSEGPIKNLVDGDVNSFFHTRWNSPQIDMPQWIQVDFNEAHQIISVYYQNRNGSQVGPSSVDLQISNDGNSWETIATLNSGLPTGSKAEYMSDYVDAGKPFTFFRFNVTATVGNVKYFNLAEFAVYDVKVETYDPETVELD